MIAKMNYRRQMDIVSPEQLDRYEFMLIGAGGIGSWSAYILTKMGVGKITVFDHDIVKPHNLPSQAYRLQDVGQKKVAALGSICSESTGVHIVEVGQKFVDQPLSGVVISAVDSMTERIAIWKRVRGNPAIPLYIEARMGGQVGRINTVRPDNQAQINWYESTLYDSSRALKLRCTERAIVFNVFSIAGLIADQVKKFVNGEDLQWEIVFDLANLMMIKHQ